MLRRFLIYFGIVILLLFIPLFVVNNLRDAALRLVSPLSRSLVNHSSNLRNALNNFRQLGELRDQNTALEKQVITLQQQLIDQQAIKDENSDLRKQLGVTGIVQQTPKVLAQVSLFNNSDPLDPTYTINVGASNGIKVGQPAVYNGTLVGRVITVRDHSAVVRSIRSQKSLIQAVIVSNQEKGIVVGTGSGAELEYITQGVTIPNQSVVSTSGLGGTLPEGILIGNTDVSLSAKSDTSQTFAITQGVDPVNIQSLFILLVSTV